MVSDLPLSRVPSDSDESTTEPVEHREGDSVETADGDSTYPDDDNPDNEESDDDDLEGAQTASKGARLLNLLVDVALWNLLLHWGTGCWSEMDSHAVLSAFDGYTAIIFYYLFFEVLFGRTPGKWLTSTGVVDLDGERPRPRQILIRSLARLVPLEPFSFLGASPSGLHDRWSRTRVVSC